MRGNSGEEKVTVVVGASPKPERYSNKAVRSLRAHGHRVIPVHPVHSAIEGLNTVARLDQIQVPIDTVTLYVSPDTGEKLVDDLVRLAPRRVIMNPGAESEKLELALSAAGIEVERACTLVLLSTGAY
ncbi:MAG: CoA-binding protein [Bdellovibrionota bacterium]